ALATALSFLLSSALCIYWIFIKKNTHVTVSFASSADPEIAKDILKVGIPTAFAQTTMSVSAALIMKIITIVGTGDHLAAYNSCWRILMLINIPAFGLAGAALSVIGAAFGAQQRDKMIEAYHYAVKTGVIIHLISATLIIVFAGKIAYIFSYTQDSRHLRPIIVTILLYLSPVFVFSPLGIITSAMFRAIKRGGDSFLASILRTVVLQLLFAWVLAIGFRMGPRGVWLGITSGNLIAIIIIFTWGNRAIHRVPIAGSFRSGVSG
ncbi:MAG: MATE family efflux transporter, partial [Fibrobacterota bacterium]